MAATVKAGKTPARRPAARDHLPKKPGAHANGTAAPGVLRFSSSSTGPEEREPIFYIDDTEYTMLADPPASIALTASRLLSEERGHLEALGAEPLEAFRAASGLAQNYVMTEMLGQDGYAALCGCRTIKAAEMRRVMEVVSERAQGALEDEEHPNR